MGSSSGSIILTAILSPKSERKVAAFLRERAKSIPAHRVNSALQNLPLVLSRNVSEETGQLVINKLRELGAQASFIPAGPADESPENRQAATAAMVAESSIGPRAGSNAAAASDPQVKPVAIPTTAKGSPLRGAIRQLLIILLLLGAVASFNLVVTPRSLLLSLFSLPTILAAFFYGRKQALLTALLSLLLVAAICLFKSQQFMQYDLAGPGGGNQWYHLLSWSVVLLLTAQAMGTLRDRARLQMQGQWSTLHGLLLILEHCICLKEPAADHSQRVALHATAIAEELGQDAPFISDIRSAALLHGIARFRMSRHLLDKAATDANGDLQPMMFDPDSGTAPQMLMQGPLGRVLPMVSGLLERFDGTGDRGLRGEEIPFGARILKVADSYDNLISGRHKAEPLSPADAKAAMEEQAGTTFDPSVVEALVRLLERQPPCHVVSSP